MPKPPKPTISDAKLARVMRWVRDHPGSKRRDIIRETGITAGEWTAASRGPLLAYDYFPTGWFCPAGATGGIDHGWHGWNPLFVERCGVFLAANPAAAGEDSDGE